MREAVDSHLVILDLRWMNSYHACITHFADTTDIPQCSPCWGRPNGCVRSRVRMCWENLFASESVNNEGGKWNSRAIDEEHTIRENLLRTICREGLWYCWTSPSLCPWCFAQTWLARVQLKVKVVRTKGDRKLKWWHYREPSWIMPWWYSKAFQYFRLPGTLVYFWSLARSSKTSVLCIFQHDIIMGIWNHNYFRRLCFIPIKQRVAG